LVNKGLAPLILNCRTRRTQLVNLLTQLLYAKGKNLQYPLNIGGLVVSRASLGTLKERKFALPW